MWLWPGVLVWLSLQKGEPCGGRSKRVLGRIRLESFCCKKVQNKNRLINFSANELGALLLPLPSNFFTKHAKKTTQKKPVFFFQLLLHQPLCRSRYRKHRSITASVFTPQTCRNDGIRQPFASQKTGLRPRKTGSSRGMQGVSKGEGGFENIPTALHSGPIHVSLHWLLIKPSVLHPYKRMLPTH